MNETTQTNAAPQTLDVVCRGAFVPDSDPGEGRVIVRDSSTETRHVALTGSLSLIEGFATCASGTFQPDRMIFTLSVRGHRNDGSVRVTEIEPYGLVYPLAYFHGGLSTFSTIGDAGLGGCLTWPRGFAATARWPMIHAGIPITFRAGVDPRGIVDELAEPFGLVEIELRVCLSGSLIEKTTQPTAKSTTRRGDWMQTYTGRQVFPLDLREEDIFIEDVAHHLALQNRFGGASRVPYTVAQHSVLVSWIVPAKHERDGIGHDKHEFAFPDVIRPLKRCEEIGPVFMEVETPLERCTRRRFHLSEVLPHAVEVTDRVILLMAEARDLMAPPPVPWKESSGCKPWPGRIRPWGWRKAERLFLARFRELFPEETVPEKARGVRGWLAGLELRFERWRFLRAGRRAGWDPAAAFGEE